MNASEEARLRQFIWQWRAQHPFGWQAGAKAIADEWIVDADFTTIKLAAFLETPDGEVMAQIVKSALPFPASAEVAVLVDAIKIAASRRTNGQLVAALAGGVLAALTIHVIFGRG